jgi:hypothetical protein
MEEHPDCQPRSAVAVNRGDDDDRQGNKDLESQRIDNSTPSENVKCCKSKRRIIGHISFDISHWSFCLITRSSIK